MIEVKGIFLVFCSSLVSFWTPKTWVAEGVITFFIELVNITEGLGIIVGVRIDVGTEVGVKVGVGLLIRITIVNVGVGIWVGVDVGVIFVGKMAEGFIVETVPEK